MSETIRTLAEVRKDLWSGTDELYAAFLESITQQQELTPDQNAMLGDYLRDITGKRDRLAAFIESLEAEAVARRNKAGSIEKQAREIEGLVRMFKSSIAAQMQNWKDGAIIKRVDGAECSFRLQKNPARIEITDKEKIPKKYRRFTWEPNKPAIADALAAGLKVPGARMADENFRVEIK